MSTPAQRAPVVAVVPVKHLRGAKSRLALPVGERRALALAFAVDTVAALTGSPLVERVVVVTTDPDVASQMRPAGVEVVPDEGDGLREAVLAGCRTAAGPGLGLLVAPADLPCLSSDDVTLLLERHIDGFVPDRTGTGSTVLLRPPGRDIDPQYGPGSAARHVALGLHRLDDVPVALRHDVDTLDDLRSAHRLGLSPRTAAASSRLPVLQRQAG